MRPLLIALALLGLSSPAFSQQTSTGGTVTVVRTGWNVDSFAIITAEPIVNPAHCATPDGYISQISFPGYRTYYAAALTAFVAKVPIVITVSNSECFAGRPKLIGINLHR